MNKTNRRLSILLASVCVAAVAAPSAPGIVEEYLRFFEARNAAAAGILAPPSQHGEMKISGEDFQRPDAIVRMRCPACKGKGAIEVEEPDFGQWAGRMGRSPRRPEKCPVCAGRKTWRAYEDQRVLEAGVAQALSAFSSAHLAKGDVSVGNAFVPRQVYDNADRKRLRLVEKTFGQECKKCNWTGLEECKRCRGEGTVKCSNKDCKGGWIVTKRTRTTRSGGRSHRSSCSRSYGGGSSHSSKVEEISVAECPVCRSTGMLVCQECNGMCSHICSKCRGTGVKSK